MDQAQLGPWPPYATRAENKEKNTVSIEFNYRDTKDGHAVTNTGYNYANSKWRFEHTKIDSDGDWVPVAVEYLELGPSSASTWEEYRERFTKAFPDAYEAVSG